MADFISAIDYVLMNEGGHYEDLATGEISNHGISLKWLKTVQPDATAKTIRDLPAAQAISLYHKYWWETHDMDLIENNHIATKLLDAMVNMGPETAIRLFQVVLNEPVEPSERIAEDGVMGKKTADALEFELGTNPHGEKEILDSFAEELRNRYKRIAEMNPVHKKDLPGWLKRAEKMPEA